MANRCLSDEEKQFARIVCRKRWAAQMTQQAFADEIGVHPSVYCRMEKGQIRFRAAVLPQVQKRLGLSDEEMKLAERRQGE